MSLRALTPDHLALMSLLTVPTFHLWQGTALSCIWWPHGKDAKTPDGRPDVDRIDQIIPHSDWMDSSDPDLLLAEHCYHLLGVAIKKYKERQP